MLIYCQWRTTQFCHQSADAQYSVLLQSWASCGNDFGTFCAKQNVVTELILYIFQGGQVPLLPMPAGVRDYNTKVNVQNCWSHVVSFTKVGRTVYQLNDVSYNRPLLSALLEGQICIDCWRLSVRPSSVVCPSHVVSRVQALSHARCCQ